jgi:hypothetical protein
MPQLIEVPGIKEPVEFPDDWSDEQIIAAVKFNLTQMAKEKNQVPFLKSASQGKSLFETMKEADARPQEYSPTVAGVGRGFVDTGEGLKQLGLQAGEALGLVDQGTADAFTKEADAERKAYEASPLGQTTGAKIGRFASNTAPWLAAPTGAALGILGRLGVGAATGMGMGATAFVPEDGSRAVNTAAGGLLGSIAPFAKAPIVSNVIGAGLGAAGANALGINPLYGLATGGLVGIKPLISLTERWTNPRGKVMETIKDSVDDPEKMLQNFEAGKRLGIHMTPAEASDSPLLGQFQGELGRTGEGARLLQRYSKGRKAQEERAITGLLDDITPTQDDAALSIRKTAQNIISKDEKALQQQAKPYYDESYQKKIAPTQLQSLMDNDPNVGNAVKEVLKDSRFAAENKGYPANSIKILDQAKKRLDAQIEKAARDGDKHLVSVLTQSKNNLVAKMDKFSPAYKEARSVYGEGAKPLETLKESNIGRIANLPDTQLKQVSRIIFDPAQTDRKAFENIQYRINKENPKAWRQIFRNELERRLDKSEYTGNNLYNKVLKGKRDFDQFHSAARSIPGAQQKLSDLKEISKLLINPMTAKAGAALARTGMLGRRDSALTLKDFVLNLVDGNFDREAVELITNPNWNKEFTEFLRKPTSSIFEKAFNYATMLGRISASLATQRGEQ